jgi:acyl transferase domain-containing protein/NAD(P)H-dependent flavin oxidoreductase YrpB (nitropropane dioxygenase family)
MHTQQRTAIWVCSPGYLKGTGLLTNAAMANAIGVIDLGQLPIDRWGDLSSNLLSIKNYPQKTSLGFRVSKDYFQALTEMPEFPSRPDIFFILTNLSQIADIAFIKQFPRFSFYIECYSPAEIRSSDEFFQREGITIAGYVLVSAEAGGQAGQLPAYILLQEDYATRLPVIVKGGIGVHTASVLPLTKAAGILLDDTVLLFPGSPLTMYQKENIARLDGREFDTFTDDKENKFRIILQSRATAAQQWISDHNSTITGTSDGGLFDRLKTLFYFGSAENSIWPLGQMVCMAEHAQQKYQSLQRYIAAIRHSTDQGLPTALQYGALKAGSSLANEHACTFPIVQGPMTRVSDSPDFALAVAKAGALPFIALALLQGDQLSTTLLRTVETLGNHSWGVGLLGFVPAALYEEQIKAVLKIKPPFAIVAGGRPDQAMLLEKEGIKTYLHVPTPYLLKLFIEQGATRFIFEGRECGGHVGPYHSFPLWEQMVETLLEKIPAGDGKKYTVLFAGGISGSLSAAMVAVLSAKLSAKDIKIGLLVGTAYLACPEVVHTGAITQVFQDYILNSADTTLLVSGPGHANRCVASPFSNEFNHKRRQLLQEGLAPEKIAEALDEMLLGRLRLASKGILRTAPGQYEKVTPESIANEGMFMAGEAARFLKTTKTIQQLHSDIIDNADALMRSVNEQKDQKAANAKKPVNVAIVGISLFVPGAKNKEEFWDIILKQENQIREIPADRWDWKLIFDADPKAEDKIYSRWGGFIDDIIFDPLKYGIPPKSIPNITTAQLLALENVTLALQDANIDLTQIDRQHTSVIFATTDAGGHLSNSLIVRNTLPFFAERHNDVITRTQGWTEETFPGVLSNVVPGRIANRLDFGGKNFAVDAACASSLVALDLSVRELMSGNSNMVIVGGVDIGQTPSGYMAFSKTGALSPTGQSMPFDKKANGIVMSEGSVVLVMKRLEDAENDGDKIYAVIKGVAGSSDGRAMGLTAPRSEGQQLSVLRAYEEAGFAPSTISYYEAHGTGTMVGDKEELDTIHKVLKGNGTAAGAVALGSVKSLIGHTKMAAGMVGLAKAALSLYYKTLPPQANVRQPLDQITAADSPVFFLEEAVSWLPPEAGPRRAGVSAFGFGGTNYHAVLEEYNNYSGKTGGDKWPGELLVFGEDSPGELCAALQALAKQLSAPLTVKLKDLAWTLANKSANKSCKCRLSITASGIDDTKDLLDKAIHFLLNPQTAQLPARICYKEQINNESSKVAFIFPGQGAQYINMAREMALYFPEFSDNTTLANRLLTSSYPKRFSDYLYPARSFDNAVDKKNEAALNDTHVAQPAIGLISSSYLDVFNRLEVCPDFLAGHSFGELTALHAAGVFNRQQFFHLAAFRGSAMSRSGNGRGAMAAVLAPHDTVTRYLENLNTGLTIANYNGPEQTVISGEAQAIAKAIDSFAASGIKCINLPVSAAFHSDMMTEANEQLNDFIADIPFNNASTKVFSNSSGKAFSSNGEEIRQSLREHLIRPVHFMSQIQEMYAAGANIFVELGPGNALTKLIGKILEPHPHIAIGVESHGEGVNGFLQLLGRLWVEGVRISLPELHKYNEVQKIAIDTLHQTHGVPEPRLTSWFVNGFSSRPVNPAYQSLIPKPLRTAEDESNQTTYMHPENINNGQELPVSQNTGAHNDANIPQYGMDTVMAAYLSYQETMRQFLRSQERVMAMFLQTDTSAISGEVVSESFEQPFSKTVAYPPADMRLPDMPPVLRASAPAPAAAPQAVGPTNMGNSRADNSPVVQNTSPAPVGATPGNGIAPPEDLTSIKDILIKIISDRTGYPDDMIMPDMDLEADLGVDSIKRLEVFNKFLSFLPTSAASLFKEQADRYVRIKKFSTLVDAIGSELGLEKNIPVGVK